MIRKIKLFTQKGGSMNLPITVRFAVLICLGLLSFHCSPPKICTSGEKKCDGNTAQTCKLNETGWETTNCASDEKCEAGECKPKDCTQGETRCDSHTAMICKADGTWDKTNCASDQRCEQGKCKKGCTVGTKDCLTLTTSRECQPDGSWQEIRCASDETCNGGSCQKNTKCEPNTVECLNDKSLRKCQSDSSWVAIPCASDETCNQGKCDKGSKEAGKEGGPCFSNQTCNEGLLCSSGTCMKEEEEYFVKGSKEGEAHGGGDTRTLNDGNCMGLPLIPYNITGYHHGSPVGSGKVHAGDDINGSAGTSIHAVWDGTVIIARHISTWGTLVEIEHRAPNGKYFVSIYGHLRSSDLAVSAGQTVVKGTRLGALGTKQQNGGWPEHLHFSLFTGTLPNNKVLAGHVKSLNGFEDPIPWMNANGASDNNSCSSASKLPEVTGLSCTNYSRGQSATCTLTGKNFTNGKNAWVAFLTINSQQRTSDASWTLSGKWTCDSSTKNIEANVSGSSGNYTSNHRLQGDCQGQQCSGSSSQVCGNCGTQTRTCNNGQWSQWGSCTGEGVCTPSKTQSCGSGGIQTCNSSCQWDLCKECTGPTSQACGNCGTQTRTCNNGQWSSWGSCSGEGVCSPNQTKSCRGTCGSGTQTCNSSCKWGTCSASSGSPSVSSVSPTTVTLGQKTMFTIYGTCLPSTIAPFIPECAGLAVTSTGSTRATFTCTPSYSPGTKASLVKDRPGGTVLYNFNVNVQCSSPSVSSVSPTTVTLGQKTTFTIYGTCLPSTIAPFIPECARLTVTSTGSTRATFTCTPSYSKGSKSSLVKDKPGGTLLYSFTIYVQ